MRKAKQEIKYFTAAEIQKFMAAIPADKARDKMIFSLFTHTAMRLNELNTLTVGHIKTALEYGILEICGKGRKWRSIPLVNGISGELKAFLSWKEAHGERMHPNAPLFLRADHKNKISNNGIQFLTKQYCRRAGIRESIAHPHAFRHACGFILNKNGIPLDRIAALFGHSSIATTEIYTRPDREMVAEAMEKGLVFSAQ